MAKLPDKPKLPYTKFVRSKGKLYAYFNTGKKVNGKLVWAALPDFSSPGFFETYAAMKGGRTKRGALAYTVSDLINAYERSEDFTRLSKGSQKTYGLTLKRISDQLGSFAIDAVKKRHIREIIDNRITGNGARNIFLAVLGVLYKYARSRDLTEAKPTEGIPFLKMGQHEPWPEALLVSALTCDDDRVRLAVHLLYYTGQRIGDICKMRWSDARNGRVNVIQEKTGKHINIRMVDALEQEINAAPKAGITILTQDNGKRLQVPTLRKWLQDYASELGFKIVPHGLRKNAVNSLLEAGCTIAETASVTGQSFEMVEHYARRVDQSRLGDAAILKLERSAHIQTNSKTAS